MIQIEDEVETLEGHTGIVEEIYYKIKNKTELVKHEHTFFKRSVTPFGEIRVGQYDIVVDGDGEFSVDDVLVKYNGNTKSVKNVKIFTPDCREYRKQKLQIALLQNKIVNAQKELQDYVNSRK